MEARGGSWNCLGKGYRQEYGAFGLETIHQSSNHIFLVLYLMLVHLGDLLTLEGLSLSD